MLNNAYLIENVGADTAENERNFDEDLPKILQLPYPYARRGAVRASPTSRGSAAGSGGPRSSRSEPRRRWFPEPRRRSLLPGPEGLRWNANVLLFVFLLFPFVLRATRLRYNQKNLEKV